MMPTALKPRQILLAVMVAAFGAALILPYAVPGWGEIRLAHTPPSPRAARQLEALRTAQLRPEQATPTVPDLAQPMRIPLKKRFGHYFLEARLNGRSATLMLDCGAPAPLTLTPQAVIRSQSRLAADGAALVVPGEPARALGLTDELTLHGQVKCDNLSFAMLPETPTVTAMGWLPLCRPDGVIGIGLLGQFRKFGLDLTGNALWLGGFPKEISWFSNMMTLQCRERDGALYLDVAIEQTVLEMRIDIGGTDDFLVLFGAHAKTFMDRHRNSLLPARCFVSGGRELKGFTGQASHVRTGGLQLSHIPVFLAPDAVPPGTHGLVGNRLFGIGLYEQAFIGFDMEAHTISIYLDGAPGRK